MRRRITLPVSFLSEDLQVVQSLDFYLPMSDGLMTQRCLLRPCYVQYYDFIIRNLEICNHVTLTGTPGIGKSVFFLYFAARFRKENPHVTLVAATFSRTQRLEECIEHRGTTRVKHIEVPTIMGAIYLFDGPAVSPPLGEKMICFTSPNANWLKLTLKSELHARMILPPWTLEELRIAERLDPLSDGNLEERFEFFGGVARYCLDSSPMVDAGHARLLDKTKTIKSHRQLLEIMNLSAHSSDVSHSIIHAVPLITPQDPPFATFFRWEFGSCRIMNLIAINLKTEEQYRSLDWADALRDTTGSGIRAWLARRRTKVVLSSQCVISAISAGTGKPETIPLSNLQFVEYDDKRNAVDASSLDDRGTMILFKVIHPAGFHISAHEIYNEIQRRTRVEDIQDCKLVWVVFTQLRSCDVHGIKIPRRLTSGHQNAKIKKLISNMSQFYTVIDRM